MTRTLLLSASALVTLGALTAAEAPPPSPEAASANVATSQLSGVDPVADQILRQSCGFLAQTRGMSLRAEVWKDEVLPSGHKIQVTRSLEMDFRRPDRLHVVERAHHKGRSIWYDGKKSVSSNTSGTCTPWRMRPTRWTPSSTS